MTGHVKDGVLHVFSLLPLPHRLLGHCCLVEHTQRVHCVNSHFLGKGTSYRTLTP